MEVKETTLKLTMVNCVREVVCWVRESICCKNVSEALSSFGKPVDRLEKDLKPMETHTAEGDLVGGLVKLGCDWCH